MSTITSSAPLQPVCMDFLSIEPDNKGIKDVLVITDHFTKFAIAVPTKNQKAQTVAEVLWDNLISIYRWPERLHSDQGRVLQAKVIAELCKLGGVEKSRTSPYNPVESYNHTLLSMLGSLHDSQKKNGESMSNHSPMLKIVWLTRPLVTLHTSFYSVAMQDCLLTCSRVQILMSQEQNSQHSMYETSRKEAADMASKKFLNQDTTASQVPYTYLKCHINYSTSNK